MEKFFTLVTQRIIIPADFSKETFARFCKESSLEIGYNIPELMVQPQTPIPLGKELLLIIDKITRAAHPEECIDRILSQGGILPNVFGLAAGIQFGNDFLPEKRWLLGLDEKPNLFKAGDRVNQIALFKNNMRKKAIGTQRFAWQPKGVREGFTCILYYKMA